MTLALRIVLAQLTRNCALFHARAIPLKSWRWKRATCLAMCQWEHLSIRLRPDECCVKASQHVVIMAWLFQIVGSSVLALRNGCSMYRADLTGAAAVKAFFSRLAKTSAPFDRRCFHPPEGAEAQ